MILQGRNLIIKMNGQAIAAAKSCTIDVSAMKIEVSGPTSGEYEEYMAGRKSWSVAVGGLVMIAQDALPTHLRTLKGWVGTKPTLTMCAFPIELYPGILPFDGLVNNVTVQQVGYVGNPNKIYWDDSAGKFVGEVNQLSTAPKYYDRWNTSTRYQDAANGSFFYAPDGIYQKQGGWVDYYTNYNLFSGTALCENIRIAGNLGNLTTYSAQFQGSGPLNDVIDPVVN